MFERAKKLYELQKQAKDLRKQLQAHSYTAESTSGSVKVTVNGEQELTQVTIDLSEKYREKPDLLSRDVLEVINKALDKSKKGSAELMRGMMGGIGLPGM